MADLYQPANPEELSQRFLRDIVLAASSVNQEPPPVGKGSDFWLTSQGLANMGLMGFYNLNLSEADQNVLTAEGQALDNLRLGYGLPEVSATPARGKIVVRISGSTTIPNGQAFLYPNGTSGKVVGTYLNPADRAELDVQCSVTGNVGNLKSGQTVRFIGTPVNVRTEATVSNTFPLTGGTDTEDDSRKRDRILNVLRNKPAGGNWAYIRQLVLDNFGNISDCFIYPALGGPGSVKVVVVKDFDKSINDYSRSVNSALLSAVRNLLQANLPVTVQTVVQTVASQYADTTLKVTIPNSSQSGGNGQGWIDIVPWPNLEVADGGKVTLSSPNATFDSFTVSANTTIAPIDGQTHIAWWSSVDRKFYSGLIVSHSGSSGAWVVSVDRPLVDSTGAGPVVGDYVSPVSQNMSGYGDAWISTFSAMGPGENVNDSRLPRAARKPSASEKSPISITNALLKTMTNKYQEITDFAFGYNLVITPTVPGLAQTQPNILIPRRFGIYSI